MVAGRRFHWSSFGPSRPGRTPRRWNPIWPPARPPRSRIPCSTRPGSRSPAATSPLPRMHSRKMAAAARSPRWKPCPGVRLVNDETRLVPEAKPFVWSAERDVVRVTLGGSAPLPASKGRLLEAARAALGGVEVVDQMNLSRGAPPRFDNAALLLLDQIGEIEGRQDHDFGHQGQPFRHGARPRRPRSDRGGAEKSPRGLFGRRQRDQGAALYLSGLQGSGRGDADADRLCARQQRPCRARGGGGAQILQRKGGRQSQGQRRRALRICQRGGAGAGRAVAAVDRHAGGVRSRGEALGRRAL